MSLKERILNYLNPTEIKRDESEPFIITNEQTIDFLAYELQDIQLTAKNCITKIAKDVSYNTQYVAYNKNTNKIYENSLFEDLKSNLNNFDLTFQETIRQFVLWYYMTGNAFIEIVTAGSRPTYLRHLASNIVKEQINQDLTIRNYIVSSGAFNQNLQVEEVISLKDIEPSKILNQNYIEGRPNKLIASLYAIRGENELYKAITTSLVNQDLPPFMFLSHPDEWDADIIEVLKVKLQKKYKNFTTIGLEGGAKVESTGVNTTSSSGSTATSTASSQKISYKQQIAESFGVAEPILTGIFTNVSTSYQLYNDYYNNTIAPISDAVADELTKKLNKWDSNLVIRAVPPSVEDPVEKDRHDRELLGTGRVTINELNERDGLNEVPSQYGSVYFLNGLVPFDNLLNPTSTNIEVEETTEEIEDEEISNEQKKVKKKSSLKLELAQLPDQNEWKRRDTQAEKQARRYDNDINDWMVGLQSTINKNLESSLKTFRKFTKAEIKADTNVLVNSLNIFNVGFWTELLKENTTAISIRNVIESIIIELRKMNVDTDNVDTEYKNELEKIIRSVNATLNTPAKTIDEDLRKEYNKQLTELLTIKPNATKQEMLDVLIDANNSKFDNQYKVSNLKRIADTTGNATFNSGNHAAINRNAEHFNVQWLTRQDDKVRPKHQELHGKIIKPTENFIVDGVNAQFPSDPNAIGKQQETASFNINCRCRIRAVRK